MDSIYFLVRHTPFWGVPLLIIGLEFAYRHWLKGHRYIYKVSLLFAFIGFFSIIFYIWAGGPEKSVDQLIEIVHYITH